MTEHPSFPHWQQNPSYQRQQNMQVFVKVQLNCATWAGHCKNREGEGRGFRRRLKNSLKRNLTSVRKQDEKQVQHRWPRKWERPEKQMERGDLREVNGSQRLRCRVFLKTGIKQKMKRITGGWWRWRKPRGRWIKLLRWGETEYYRWGCKPGGTHSPHNLWWLWRLRECQAQHVIRLQRYYA